MRLDLKELRERARGYVELEAHVKVKRVTFAERFLLMGSEDVVLSVSVEDRKDPEWWVVVGSTPMNLYLKSVFKTADEAFTMHIGLMLRMSAKDFTMSKVRPDAIGYNAFISHASEDKASLVRSLAKALDRLGFAVWYDEFELKVGDSLKESIDKGLLNSNYGIVVLSKAFFSKKWPQYEINGLTSREIEGQKVILPVWHGVTRQDVLKYSPTLADKVAVATHKKSILRVAEALAKVLNE